MTAPAPRRAHPAAALALGGVLMLGACGNDPGVRSAEADTGGGVAAVIDGREVSIGELQQTTRQVNDALRAQGQAQTLPPRDVLTTVIAAPALEDYAREKGLDVPSDGAAQKALGTEETPTESTLDFVRASLIFGQLDQQQAAEVLDRVRKSDPKVNPRYARPDGLVPDELPNWLVAQPAAAS